MPVPYLRVTPKTHKQIHALKRKRVDKNVDQVIQFLLVFYNENKKSIGELAAELKANRGGF